MGRRACKAIGRAGIVSTVSFIIPCREINSMVVGLVHNLSILLPENHDVIVSLDRDHLLSEEESIIGGFPPTTRCYLVIRRGHRVQQVRETAELSTHEEMYWFSSTMTSQYISHLHPSLSPVCRSRRCRISSPRASPEKV